MLLRKYFTSMFTAPHSVAVASREGSLYLMRANFVAGIGPIPQRYALLYRLWSCVINFDSLFYLPIGFAISYVIRISEFTPSQLLDSLQAAINAWACAAKVIVVWTMRSRFDLANEVLDEIDKRCKRKEEQQKIRVAVALCNRVFFIYVAINLSYATTNFLDAVYNGHPPYQLYYAFLDWRADRLQFWAQSLHEYFSIFGACFQDACVDCYPVVYVILLRTHIKLLSKRIRNLGTDAALSDRELYDELVNCIIDHKTLLRFCDTIRPLISITIFIQFLVIGIVIGLTFINIVLFSDFASGIGGIFFLSGVLLEITPLCIMCSYLIDDCNDMADSVFFSDWIDKEKRYKKTLIYFLQNVQQPIIFNAINVVPITLETNISILKFSFSVFTLVKEMHIAERLTKKLELE